MVNLEEGDRGLRVEAFERLGMLYKKQGRFHDALDNFREADELSYDEEYPEANMFFLSESIELLTEHPIDDDALAEAYESWIDRVGHANERPEYA